MEKRRRRQLNHKVHEQATFIWLGAGAILLCILWVVYFVASRPKNVLVEDEGRKAVQEAIEQLLQSTKQGQADSTS